MYDVDLEIGDITSRFHLDNEVYILTSDSGSGKSLFINLLYTGLKRQNVSVFSANYSVLDYGDAESLILNGARRCSVVLLDNADLYMSKSLCRSLKDLGIPAVIALHDFGLIVPSICKIYKIVIESGKIDLERYIL